MLKIFFCLILLSNFRVYGQVNLNMEQKLDIFKTKLQNGLNIVLVPIKSPDISTTSIRILVKSGSTSDTPGKTGLAHYLEHLMFLDNNYKTTLKDLTKKNPIIYNAQTSYFTTIYHCDKLHKDQLERYLQIEAKRFSSLKIDPKQATQELKVILEEASMGKCCKYPLDLIEAIKLFFRNGQYSTTPIIGRSSEIAKLTLADAMERYKNLYTPDKIIIVIVGNFDKDHILSVLEKLFGNIPAQKNNGLTVNTVKQDTTEKRKYYIKRPADKPYASMMFIWKNGPSLSKPDETLAFSIITRALTGTNGALTQHFIKDKKLASDIWIFNYAESGFSLITIAADLNKDVSPDVFEKEMEMFLKNLSNKGIDETQFNLAQKGEIIFQIKNFDSIKYIAWETLRLIENGLDPNIYNNYISICNSITIRYANKLFRNYFSETADLIAVTNEE